MACPAFIITRITEPNIPFRIQHSKLSARSSDTNRIGNHADSTRGSQYCAIAAQHAQQEGAHLGGASDPVGLSATDRVNSLLPSRSADFGPGSGSIPLKRRNYVLTATIGTIARPVESGQYQFDWSSTP
jgi:hypothetical protein